MAGSVIFLVEGQRGAVFHTGDLRAEPVFLNSLSRDHLLLPYLSRSDDSIHGSAGPSPVKSFCRNSSSPARSLTSSQSELAPVTLEVRYGPLQNIYIDDERLSAVYTSPSKVQAGDIMISYMRQYPPDTRFFLDAWCWGYESVLHRVHKAFGKKVHVDRYKFGMYKAGTDEDFHLPSFVSIRPDGDDGRFHACERTSRCSLVSPAANGADLHGPLIVEVKFGSGSDWQERRAETERSLQAAARGDIPWPSTLIVPFERHSCWSEIKAFVALFRPLQVTSNTANLHNWFVMSKVLTALMAPGAAARMERSAKS